MPPDPAVNPGPPDSSQAPGLPPRNLRLEVQYDGTGYHGWQIQPRLRTIQGELTRTLESIVREQVHVCGSGRTDAGAHALAQICHFHTTSRLDVSSLWKALNSRLPATIRVTGIETVAADFHARHHARTKHYRYRTLNTAWCPPFEYPYVQHFYRRLDYEKLNCAAELVVGRRDFSAFCDADSQAKCKIRKVTSSLFVFDTRRKLLEYNVCADGFLHHMVRNLVGTFLEVGRGKLPVEAIPAILESRDRSRAGPTAPAKGLFLVRVGY